VLPNKWGITIREQAIGEVNFICDAIRDGRTRRERDRVRSACASQAEPGHITGRPTINTHT
jgi:hypothetical protein